MRYIDGKWMSEARARPYVERDEARAEAERWKRIAQDRCTCRLACGDTPEDSDGVCKELPRAS